MRNASWIKIFVVTFSQTFVVQIHGTNVSFAKFFFNVIFHFFFFNGVTSIQDRSDDGVHVWLVEKRYGKPNSSRFIYHSMKRGLAAQCSKVRKIVQKKLYKNRNKIFLKLTVAVPEIWDILEIQKMKICSEVPNFMGKMNFRSKCA